METGKMYIMPFYKGNVEKLYDYVIENFRDVKSNGVYSNLRRESIGFFGHVKLMEAQAALYKATKEQKYLDGLRRSLVFCAEHRRENGINNFWNLDFTWDSNWIETNHLGILAYCTFEYWLMTGDDGFNEMAINLMESIPGAADTKGAFIDGCDNQGKNLDDRQYLADNSEIMLGWWACCRMTGRYEYKKRYEQIMAFMETNFRTVEHQPLYNAWLVGPKHIKYGEGSSEYCDTGHTTYEQFFISRNIMLIGPEEYYSRLVCSTDWVMAYSRFDDGLVGYNAADDKMIGWSAYFASQAYWAYVVSGNPAYYNAGLKTANTIVSLQDETSGTIPPIIPVEGRIDWPELDGAREGLGTIWQLAAVLQGLAMTEASSSKNFSLHKLSTGPTSVLEAFYDNAEGAGKLIIGLTGSGREETYRIVVKDAEHMELSTGSGNLVEVIEGYNGAYLDLVLKDEDGTLELKFMRKEVISDGSYTG